MHIGCAILRLMRGLVVVASLVLVAGCDGGESGTDGGTVPNPDAAVVVPWADPIPPALPDFGVCPEGWRTVSMGEGVEACDPYGGSGVSACEDFEAHFPGMDACQRVGTVCPADGWPTELPGTGVVFVRAGSSGGDGTRALPFGTVGAGLAAASIGDVVAVAVGTYDEAVVVPAGVTLQGACAEGVVLTSTASSFAAGVLTVRGADTAIANLTIGPSARPGLWVQGAAASLTVTDLVVTDVTMLGVNIEGAATFEGTRVVVRRPGPVDGMILGYGLNVEGGADATIDHLHVEGAVDFGVVANLEETVLRISDAVILDTAGLASGDRGFGLLANGGARIEATRVAVERATQIAAMAMGPGSFIELTDAVLRDTREGTDVELGRGLVVQSGAEGRVSRALIERNKAAGIVVGDAQLLLEDVVVREISTATAHLGRGIVGQRSNLVGRRIFVGDVLESGVEISGEGSTADIEDLTVVDVAPSLSNGFGRGVSSYSGGALTLTRARIQRVFESGIGVQWSSSLVARDVLIDDVQSRPLDGEAGYGVAAQLDSTVDLSNAIIRNTHQVAVIALEGTTRVDLDSIEVVGVESPPCVDGGGCVVSASGHAFGVYAEASLDATNFSVRSAVVCGVHVAAGGTAHLQDGEVAGSAIGACIQSDAQALGALQERVLYRDNDTNLQATALPVPLGLAGVEE